MNAEQVIEKILSEARQKAGAILEEARQKAARLSAEQQEQLKAYEAQSKEAAEAAAQNRLERLLAGARMEVRKQVLAAKVQTLDELFAKARQAIHTMGDEDYRRLMERLMVEAVQSGDEEVVIGKNETRLNADFIKQVNRRLGDKGRLRLADDRADIEGGFLLRRGKVRINASVAVLIDQLREQMEPQLVRELFPERT